jgi:hypothetical protein
MSSENLATESAPNGTWLSALKGIFASPDKTSTAVLPTDASSPLEEDSEPVDMDASGSPSGVSIRAFLPEVGDAPETPQSVCSPETSRATEHTPPKPSPSAMLQKMAEDLQAHAALTERYARAGYQIGKLESEVHALKTERQALQVKLLESEQLLADSRLNEQVLKSERERALTELQAALLRLAETGERSTGGLAAVRAFLRRHW